MTDEKNEPVADEQTEEQQRDELPRLDGGEDGVDDVICELNRSVWYKPFHFVGSLLLMLASLASIFFVTGEWANVGRYVLGGLFLIGLVWLLAYLFVTKVAATYRISEMRCQAEIGFISREIREVEIRHIRNINVRQTILQRVCGIGDVEISTAGGAGIEVSFQSVADPLNVRRMIMDRK
jgi:uncharacterized membrane protein YdbT with pleckstrin-like domain